MRLRSLVPALAAVLAALVASSCSSADSLGPGLPEPGLFATDSGADADGAPVDDGALVTYCPTNKCPKGHTTCPASNFPCDVNLLTDMYNCGACGVICPRSARGGSFDCVDGQCMMTCHVGDPWNDHRRFGDCDGVIDNGCETLLQTDDNCKACGRKCDPGKHCVDRGREDIDCGCHEDQMDCPGPNGEHRCVETRDNDWNCGACGRTCDSTGGGAPSYSHSYYGCRDSTCGNIKCDWLWGDCDGVIGTGCEASLVTNENCGGCGVGCQAGMECRYDLQLVPRCMCPPGETFCSGGSHEGVPVGICANFLTNRNFCGSCDTHCDANFPNGNETCVYGVCRAECNEGWADCNGDGSDGCETNTDSDPANCGGCGIACDAIAGQACVGGRCVVAPCEPADGGGVTK